LLEAMYYLAFGKSFQSHYDPELIRFSQEHFRISANCVINKKKHTIEAAADKNRKSIKVDKTNLDKLSELYNYLKVIYFSPEDISIISGYPSNRRIFFDQAISQYSYEYLNLLREYNHTLKQRNALLKSDFNLEEKRSWDSRFVKLASNLIEKRLEYLGSFEHKLKKYYEIISGEEEEVRINYNFSFKYKAGECIGNLLQEHLNRHYEYEKEMQRTSAGPHLDDYDLIIKDRLAKRYASHGQKRTLAITLKLAQSDIITTRIHEKPILMFDDILADLDRSRADKVMKLFADSYQLFVATPNVEMYKGYSLPKIDLEKLK